MDLLTRYIFRQSFLATVVVGFVLTGIVWLAQSLKFIDLVARKGAPALLFGQMVLYLLPNLVIVVLPIAVFVSVIFVYDKLIADHEMVVMQAVGISFRRLIKPAILMGVLMSTILYAFTLYLLPVSFRKFRDIEYALKQEISLYFIQPGQFSSFGKYTFYVHNRLSKDHLAGILVYDSSKENSPVTYTAEEGYVVEDEAGTRLVLQKGTRQEVDKKTGRPSLLTFDQYTVETSEFSSSDVHNRSLKPYERFIGDLLNPEGEEGQGRRQLFAAAHQRIVSPLYALVFALVGSCFLVLGRYNRRGRFKTIAMATLTVAGIQVTATALLNATEFLEWAIPMTYLMLVLIILAVFFAVRRVER